MRNKVYLNFEIRNKFVLSEINFETEKKLFKFRNQKKIIYLTFELRNNFFLKFRKRRNVSKSEIHFT